VSPQTLPFPQLVEAAKLVAANRNSKAAAAREAEDHAWDDPQRDFMAAMARLARTPAFARVSQGRYVDVGSLARRFAMELPQSWENLLTDAKPQWSMLVRLVGMRAYFDQHILPLLDTCRAARAAVHAAATAAAAAAAPAAVAVVLGVDP